MYQKWDRVRMAPDGGSYIKKMRETFRENPVVEIIGGDGGCYTIMDYKNNYWRVNGREILWYENTSKIILFL